MSNNYTYIIASIPVLSPSFKAEGGSVRPMLEWIESQLDSKDRERVELVCRGFRPDALTEEFYKEAFSTKDGFTKEFFAADLALRNAKVAYLNKALERPETQDVMNVENAPAMEADPAIKKIFQTGNLLERERAIDDYLWSKADEITVMSNFKLADILAICAKLCIIERWLSLDQETGRELLSQLVGGIRGSYGTINFENFR